MGTPDFSVPPLKSLHKNGYTVAAVVTQPDRPKGRGRKVISPPVKRTAIALGCEILQPESIRTDRFEARIKQIEPDFFVVAAFGHVLPKHILSIPKFGAINIHASLLPKYRGAAPIQWAIINGEKRTGITTMLMDEGLDTGDILLTESTDITPKDTAGTLHDRLSEIGADLLIKTLKGIERSTISPIPQDHSAATYAPMLQKKDGLINWEHPAETIETFIRGMNPWPCAFTVYQNRRIKVYRAEIAEMESPDPPGTVIRGFADELRVAAGEKAVSILELQGESGKRLPVNEFLRGRKIPPGTRLG
jgi:methionyl-tRNA formyltransferase